MTQKRMRHKNYLFLLFILVLGTCLVIPANKDMDHVIAKTTNNGSKAVGIQVEYHTENEIRAYLKKSGAKIDDPVTYKVKPKAKKPYNPGKLSDETLNSSLKMLNQIRYIAGISHNIKLNDDANKKAQAASLVNYVNGVLSHYPEKPSDMDDKTYQLGYEGASSSNLAYGTFYDTINKSLVLGYMDDGDMGNIPYVGHRRWLLNPSMSGVGFGFYKNYSATYVFDMKNKSATEYGVAWPAQTMPTDYFGNHYPWSISLGDYVVKDQIKVTLTRLRDKKKWKFSNSSSDGYFNVDNTGYGDIGCIIFRPDDIEGYFDGDVFEVKITGLSNPVSYQVTFFDLVPVKAISISSGSNNVLEKGHFTYLQADITPSNASNKNIVWTSSNQKVAKINKREVEGAGFGTATITASGSGKKATYKIKVVPETVYVNDLYSYKKNQFTITYDKVSGVSGYEVVYASNEAFTKNKKVKVVKKASTTKATITGLKSGQRYYVKIRAFYEKDGKKIYGSYNYLYPLDVIVD